MPVGNPNAQTLASKKYAEKVGYVSKSYKMKKEIVQAFAEACQKNGESQASVLTKFMKEYCEKTEHDTQ